MNTPQAADMPTASPHVTLETQEFWDAIARGAFLLKRCDACSAVIWYPRSMCPECGSLETSWFEASGKGSIYTYTVVHRAQGPWVAVAPYVVAYVELDEGPRIMTNIVDVDLSSIECGQRVEAVYHRAPDGGALYRFRPATI